MRLPNPGLEFLSYDFFFCFDSPCVMMLEDHMIDGRSDAGDFSWVCEGLNPRSAGRS
jgi:hypothetical protein